MAILRRLEMSAAGAEGQMDWIVEHAQSRYDQAHPSVGSGWQAITTAGGYLVAVGKQTRGFRVLDWVPPENNDSLSAVVGANAINPPQPDGMADWLTKMLRPTGQDWTAIEQRLWIAMAYTNRWIRD